MTQPAEILVIGYGNPGRGDDGLGPAAAAALEELAIPGVTVDADYQLAVEDAAAVAQHEVVVFVDADVGGPEPFGFRKIEPTSARSFSSHSVRPEAVLGLARDLFASQAEGYVLGIRGYDFEMFGESLTPKAQANLGAALAFLAPALRRRRFGQTQRDPGRAKALAARDRDHK